MLVLSLLACHHLIPPPPLGQAPADSAQVDQIPALAHFATALDTQPTVAQLFDPLQFQTAPDPSAWLSAIQAANAAHHNDGPELRVLSVNVALLDANVFGFIPYAETPHLAERRGELPDLVLSQGYDIVLVQEAWRKQDVQRFERVAAREGYRVHEGPRSAYDDGLLTFVKAERLENGAPWVGGASPYQDRDKMEFFPGPGIKRGYTWVETRIEGIGPIAIFNTHMQAWPANWHMRMGEARQLGLAMTGYDLAIVGGDLNGGSYYKTDTWTRPDGTVEAGWWSNTLSYSLLQHYGELTDLVIAGRSAEDATLDVTLGDTVPNLPDRALAEPMGDADWCARTHGIEFSATDCTPLYFEQYAGTEYPARMDHLMARDVDQRVWVEQSALALTEDVRFRDLPPMPPSDHLAVEVTLRVRPDR